MFKTKADRIRESNQAVNQPEGIDHTIYTCNNLDKFDDRSRY